MTRIAPALLFLSPLLGSLLPLCLQGLQLLLPLEQRRLLLLCFGRGTCRLCLALLAQARKRLQLLLFSLQFHLLRLCLGHQAQALLSNRSLLRLLCLAVAFLFCGAHPCCCLPLLLKGTHLRSLLLQRKLLQRELGCGARPCLGGALHLGLEFLTLASLFLEPFFLLGLEQAQFLPLLRQLLLLSVDRRLRAVRKCRKRPSRPFLLSIDGAVFAMLACGALAQKLLLQLLDLPP
mmetsp:Transcript_75003/g.160634  ORF Transcript_75003/g.160634 Transcript_75003/m.160634 type:complete len:234 (+) Transcript_75003:1142-1843(+)